MLLSLVNSCLGSVFRKKKCFRAVENEKTLFLFFFFFNFFFFFFFFSVASCVWMGSKGPPTPSTRSHSSLIEWIHLNRVNVDAIFHPAAGLSDVSVARSLFFSLLFERRNLHKLTDAPRKRIRLYAHFVLYFIKPSKTWIFPFKKYIRKKKMINVLNV